MNDTSIYIVVPAYNEADRIETVIQDLRQAGWHKILVINDGSQDGTAERAQQSGAQVITLPENRGQGAAIQAGFNHLLSIHPKVIVTFDADGQHHAKDIAALVHPILVGNTDIVLGSRFLDKKTYIPWKRYVFLKIGIVLTRLLTGLPITDVHNGLRALSPKAYTTITLTQRRMAHASEFIELIARLGLRWQEVPVRITYDEDTYKAQHHWRVAPLGLYLLWLRARRIWEQHFPQAN